MQLIRRIALVLGASLALATGAIAQQQFVNVLTGGQSGVYYPLGVALSQIYAKAIPNVRSTAQVTKASAENLNLLQAGRGELALALGDAFYIGVASRILIFGLAATSLNLILGFGGMVSFGHAAFVGVGAYAAGILMQNGIHSAGLALLLALVAAAVLALLIGAISLRTRGVYFIMITLAFAQMLYYLMVSLKTYAIPAIGLVLVLSVGVFLAVQRLLNAPFGHALQAIRENEARMLAIGFAVYRFKLMAFTLAGALAGLAGALLANQSGFVSPSMMQWSESGMLMVMVILGGVGHLYGGLVGAVVFLLLEELLSAYTIHWQLGLGAVLLAVVLMAPNGLLSLRLGRKSP